MMHTRTESAVVKKVITGLFGFFLLSGVFGNLYGADAEALPVIGIQWEMKEEYVLNQELFWLDAELALRQGLEQALELQEQLTEHPKTGSPQNHAAYAAAAVAEELDLPVILDKADEFLPGGESAPELPVRPLVVFPEYTSVFLSLNAYGTLLSLDEDFLVSWNRVRKRSGSADLEELFIREHDEAEEALARWRKLAEKYRVYLIPGTFMIPDGQTGALRNSFAVIDPRGEIIYQQDKVFTTPFEDEFLEIERSSVKEADTFSIAGREIAVTICRDTFFEAWEAEFTGADLWIDIKANGARFNQTEEQRFQRAVPERIDDGVSRYGMTLCLTGSFLDLFWEGESSVITGDGELIAGTRDPEDFAVITFLLP